MNKEILRYYLLDIVFTCFSFYVLFKTWEDDIVSERIVKLIKWSMVLFFWIFFTFPAIIDLTRALTKNYIIMTGEVIMENLSNSDSKNIIRIFDEASEETISLTIVHIVSDMEIKIGDLVTVEYLPRAKYGRIIKIHH